MTLQEILNLDAEDVERLAKNDINELRRLTSQLRKTAVRRKMALEAAGLKTPSFSTASNRGDFDTVVGKSVGQLRRQFGGLRRFLTSGQSTVKEAREFESAVKEALGIEDLTPGREKKFWTVYNRLKESYGEERLKREGSDKVAQFLHDELVGNYRQSADALFEKAENFLKSSYESREMRELETMGGGASGTSRFFED